jgi:NAD(P)H dehydrogenase (quinone)
MAKILICYYSRTGNTRKMAELIARSAGDVQGAEVDLRSVEEVKVDDLLGYDGLILGSPTYYGTPAAEIKRLVDDSVCFHGQLAGKVGGAFSSSANVGGGNETTIMDMLKILLIHGMVVAGSATGDHYGPVAIGKGDERSAGMCENYGRLVAELAVKLHG